MNLLILLITRPKTFCIKVLRRLLVFLPDELYLKIFFRLILNKTLDLENPKTFNEKIQWLKLYDRKPEYTQMVCKYEAKEYIKRILGEEYIIPTLGVWNNVDEIDFDSLPDQFVLKCTHDSGGVVICKDKSRLDIKAVKRKLRKCLRHDYYATSKEWPYKNIKRRIIAEKYMVDESGYELKDYKLFCFNGKVKCLKVDFDRTINHHHTNYYDVDWNILEFGSTKYTPDYSKATTPPPTLDSMITIAEKISKDLPFVRVDLYSIYDKVYFGEITFYHASGFGKLTSEEWEHKLGSWIELPKK